MHSEDEMNDKHEAHSGDEPSALDAEQRSRRDFLLGLGRWSKVVIGAAVFGGLAVPGADARAGAWVNRRGGVVRGGGAWVNGSGGGGSWVNRRGVGGWING
jgi:hypothetical protein